MWLAILNYSLQLSNEHFQLKFDSCTKYMDLFQINCSAMATVGTVQDWLTIYKSDRKQYVSKINHSLTTVPIRTGDTQRFILKPFLFILYIIDIVNVSC